jgi:hypothetical protein
VSLGGDVRVLVGDRTGRVLAELEPQIESCAWRLNAVGRMALSLARTDEKATAENLRWGNRILVQFDNGLPNWGGVIDAPRTWLPDGGVAVEAYSGEQILGWRRTGRSRELAGVTVGTVFRTLIEEANAERDTGITVGSVFTGGEAFSPGFHYETLLEIVQEQLLAHRLSAYDFYIEAGLSNGVISFEAHFYERRGTDRPGVAVIEDRNAVHPELLEQGPVVNDWAVAGPGSTWGDERSSAVAQDTSSIAAYDLRQGFESHTEATTSAAVTAIAVNRLLETAQPRNRVRLGATDLAPARFSDYDVGDAIQVVLPSYGFRGYDHLCRVLTREYDPSSQVCDLVVEEWD